MRKKVGLPNSWLTFIVKDVKFYSLILASFTIGGIIAAVFAFTLPELSCKELLLYLEDFFRNMNESGADAAALFRSGLLTNLKNFGFLFFFSVTIIGAPLIILFSAVKGFAHGFTLFFMFRLYSMKATLFFLLGMLPHYLILIPCYLGLCAVSLKFSVILLHEKYDFKKNILRLIFLFAGFFMLATMATLMQAYIEPLLIRLVAGLYLS